MNQLPFSASWIAQTLNLPAPVTDVGFSAFSTDTRKVRPTEFFVAIKGDNFDGHDFLDAAVGSGVKGVLCQKGRAPKGDAAFVAEVDDVVVAFRKLASAWRTELGLPVVAITGAVGKTTTKEFLAACLRGKYPEVLKTEGSFNGFVGIPITLMNLRREHKAAVIEIGIDDIGAMKQHIELVKPNALVVTAIAEEHLENLLDLATVAREELVGMGWVESHGGHTVFNLDDPWIEKEFRRKSWKNARTVSLHDKRSTGPFTLGHSDGQTVAVKAEREAFSLPLMLPGNHNAQNLLLAVAVAESLGLTAEEITRGLKTFEGPKGRSEVHRLDSGVTVLADYYNASPASMRASLKLFDEIARPRQGHRWLFLGDMRELGEHELALHVGLVPDVKLVKPTQVVLFGPLMKSLAYALKKDLEKSRAFTLRHFESMEELLAETVPQVKGNDTVVIKGSRGMRMERIWEAVRQGVTAK